MASNWDEVNSPQARSHSEHAVVLLDYDRDLKALHFWMIGIDGEQSIDLHYNVLEQLYEAFPLAFESKVVIQFDTVYAVLSDEGCRCELDSLASLITSMLKEYLGYLPECLNTVAEQAAKEFGDYVVRLARRDSLNPSVVY